MMKKIAIGIVSLLFIALVACSENDQTKEVKKEISSEEKAQYIEKGKAIALQTFTALSGALSEKLQSGGVPEAITYCNVNAYPLTDSIAALHNVTVKRASDKARNQSNLPSSFEAEVLAQYQNDISSGEQLKPVLKEVNGEVYFMAPIRIKPLCLTCHGTPEVNISTDNLALIREKYPKDKAINYAEGDLRGIWSIRFSE
jgi:hypothetical protein